MSVRRLVEFCTTPAQHSGQYSLALKHIAKGKQCAIPAVIACRAYDQEKARGQSTFELEMWVENMVQLGKGTTKFRCTLPLKTLENSAAQIFLSSHHAGRSGRALLRCRCRLWRWPQVLLFFACAAGPVSGGGHGKS